MKPLIKAEFRKLFTVRSTYVAVGIAFAFVTLFAFYIEGIRATGNIMDPLKLAREIINAVSSVSIFGAIVGLMLFGNEYRYNTIMYTLTSSNSRSKTLLSKILAMSVFAVGFSLLVAVYSPLMTRLGLQIKGFTLVPQTIAYGSLLWKVVFTGWAYGMLGLLLAALLRNQIAAIVMLLITPITVEPLLTLLLKHNSIYLPFSALQQVTNTTMSAPPPQANIPYLTPGKGAMVFATYLLVGWVVTWILFLRRDAN